MSLYWAGSRNFGDALNLLLYRAITGKLPERKETSPKILAIGSILRHAKPADTVWGTGAISVFSQLQCDASTIILALRGPLSAALTAATGANPPDLYGDPALLLPEFIDPPSEKTHTIGYFPHHRDFSLEIALPKNAVKIDAWGMTRTVLDTILSCKMIVSSSLHGIVVAEAYGIPAIWIELSDNVAGRGFKFADYYLGTGRLPNPPLDWRSEQSWSQIPALVKSWKPPIFDAKELLCQCPFA